MNDQRRRDGRIGALRREPDSRNAVPFTGASQQQSFAGAGTFSFLRDDLTGGRRSSQHRERQALIEGLTRLFERASIPRLQLIDAAVRLSDAVANILLD